MNESELWTAFLGFLEPIKPLIIIFFILLIILLVVFVEELD